MSVDYHFIMSRYLYSILLPIATSNRISINKLIREFLVIGLGDISFVYKGYGWQERSTYESVDTNGIVDIHIFLKDITYAKLKMLHGTLNTFSIAQIVRQCICLMVMLLRRYGSLENAKVALSKMEKITRNKKNTKRIIMWIHKIRHKVAPTHVSYWLIELYIEYLRMLQ